MCVVRVPGPQSRSASGILSLLSLRGIIICGSQAEGKYDLTVPRGEIEAA